MHLCNIHVQVYTHIAGTLNSASSPCLGSCDLISLHMIRPNRKQTWMNIAVLAYIALCTNNVFNHLDYQCFPTRNRNRTGICAL